MFLLRNVGRKVFEYDRICVSLQTLQDMQEGSLEGSRACLPSYSQNMYSMYMLRPCGRSGLSSPPTSRDISMHPSAQSQMQPSQIISDQGSQTDNSGLSQIEKGARPRTAEERCSWLQGGNPYIGFESHDSEMECCKICRRAWPVDEFDNHVCHTQAE